MVYGVLLLELEIDVDTLFAVVSCNISPFTNHNFLLFFQECITAILTVSSQFIWILFGVKIV